MKRSGTILRFALTGPILALALCLSVVGCSDSHTDRKAIEAVLLQRQQALASKDLPLYLSIISPDYHNKGTDYAAKRAEIAATFAAFDRIDYRATDRRVEIHGDNATVAESYTLRVVGGGKGVTLAGREEVRFRREAGGWKIVGGL